MDQYLKHLWPIGVFTVLYLVIGGTYFINRGNFEFIIYVALIIVVFWLSQISRGNSHI